MDEWIKAADGFLLLFAINDKESFTALKGKLKNKLNNSKMALPLDETQKVRNKINYIINYLEKIRFYHSSLRQRNSRENFFNF